MRIFVPAALAVFLVVAGASRAVAAQAPANQDAAGAIEGQVIGEDGSGIPGSIATLEPLHLVQYTDQNGMFAFRRVPAGVYRVIINIGELEAQADDVRVTAGAAVRVTRRLPGDFRVSMTTTVSAASRALEQQLEAPVAVGVINENTIALEGGAGQLPSLLQSMAGAEYAQSGVYDIEFNSRGFNGALTRRVQVLVDGRDLAAPESKNQEWLSVGFLASELESVELVRGPGAALYGANSINGVMAMTTKSPRASPGGRARITTGDLGTLMADVRWAGALGNDWYLKVLANHTGSGSFTQSRTQSVEYKGLPLEVVPALTDVKANSGEARLDKYFTGAQLVLDGGFTDSGGGTYLTQAGRLSINDSKRSWSRVSFTSGLWTSSAYLNTRYATQTALYAPVIIPTATQQFKFEVQGNQTFAASRGRAVFGGSYLQEHVDSANDAGVQTLYLQPLTTREPALFGQLDFDIVPTLRAVGALRWDASSLHDEQVSPRAALVYLPSPGHSVHVSYNRGFQVGNYTELFLNVPLAPPLDLGAFDAAFAPLTGGVALGFKAVPIFGIGNTNLDVEKIESVEVGYTATFQSRARLSIDVYRNSMRNFISDLLPGINPAFPAYRAPSTLPPAVRAIIEQTVNAALPGLTTLPTGGPAIVLSNANVGLVTSRGVEIEGAFKPRHGWTLDSSYTWFGFTIAEAQPGLEPKPNAPAHRAALGVTYERPRLALSFRHRWVDGFTWASGVFAGPVPSYNVSDLNGSYSLTRHLQIGTNISNLFDRAHYEMFGGDILRRRALAHLTATW